MRREITDKFLAEVVEVGRFIMGIGLGGVIGSVLRLPVLPSSRAPHLVPGHVLTSGRNVPRTGAVGAWRSDQTRSFPRSSWSDWPHGTTRAADPAHSWSYRPPVR